MALRNLLPPLPNYVPHLYLSTSSSKLCKPFEMLSIIPAVLTTLAISPLFAYAGMYGEPVVNLDAKTFKSVMSSEHASVNPSPPFTPCSTHQ